MTWTKLSDDFADRPSMLDVSRSARLLLVEMYVWSNKHLTDGLVPAKAMRVVTDSPEAELDAKELVEAGLLEREGSGYQLDWSDQDTAEMVERQRVYNADKTRRSRERAGRHKVGDHSMCIPTWCRLAGVTGNATGKDTGVVTNSLPGPSRPVPPKEKGRVTRSGSASQPPSHEYEDDGGGHDTCARCELPAHHPGHRATA